MLSVRRALGIHGLYYLMSTDGVERGICEFSSSGEQLEFMGFEGLLDVDWWC